MAYVDYRTFTEVDPWNRVVIAENRITWTDQSSSLDSWVYKDYGAGYFTDFVHQFEIKGEQSPPDANNIHMSAYCVAEFAALGHSLSDLPIADVHAISVGFYNGANDIRISLHDAKSNQWDFYNDYTWTEIHYVTVTRSGATVTVELRTGSHAGSLVDTLTLATDETAAFQLMYGHLAYNSAQLIYDSGYVQNLDINAGGGGVVGRSYGLIL